MKNVLYAIECNDKSGPFLFDLLRQYGLSNHSNHNFYRAKYVKFSLQHHFFYSYSRHTENALASNLKGLHISFEEEVITLEELFNRMTTCDKLAIGECAWFSGHLIMKTYDRFVDLLDPSNTWTDSALVEHKCILANVTIDSD